LSDTFSVQNVLKQGDVLSPLLVNFVTKYAIKKVQESQVGLKLNETHERLAYVEYVNLLGDSTETLALVKRLFWKKHTEN
jgi:hypothetical protein